MMRFGIRESKLSKIGGVIMLLGIAQFAGFVLILGDRIGNGLGPGLLMWAMVFLGSVLYIIGQLLAAVRDKRRA
jgi:hypothetical protein